MTLKIFQVKCNPLAPLSGGTPSLWRATATEETETGKINYKYSQKIKRTPRRGEMFALAGSPFYLASNRKFYACTGAAGVARAAAAARAS